jgi:hypothetical protein
MSAIPTERKALLLRKLFEILAQSPDGIQARDALDQLERQMPPTEYEQSKLEGEGASGGCRSPSGMTTNTLEVSVPWEVVGRCARVLPSRSEIAIRLRRSVRRDP